MTIKALFLTACFLTTGLNTPSLYSQNFTFSTIAGGAEGSANGQDLNAQFYSPTGVAVDGAGNLYVADQNNNVIRKITPFGTDWIVTTIAGGVQGSLDGTNIGARFYGPAGIAIDSSGRLYVTDQYNSTIRQITPSGTNWVVTTIAGSAGFSGYLNGTNSNTRFSDPAGIAVDASGNIFVADEVNNSIRKITPAGTNWIVTTIAGSSRGDADGTNGSAQFSGPSGVAADASGRVFVSDQFNNTIRLITPAGTNWVVSTIAGESISGRSDGTGTNAHFHAPLDVAVDGGNNVYVADLFNNAIRKMTPSGTNWTVTTIAGGSAGTNDGAGINAQFNLPFGLAADAFGNVFVADSQNNAIRLGAAVGSPSPTGGVQVAIIPSSAASAGAGWRLDGGSLQASGATLSGLAPGNHTISFTAGTGYITPAMQTIVVTARQTIAATGSYPGAIANAGALQVFMSPVGAVDAGALWRVGAGGLQTNGADVVGLSVSTDTVSFITIPGWTTPPSQGVIISNGQTTLVQGTYVLQAGSLQVTLFPAGVVAAGAKWKVDGGSLQTSGTTLSSLSPGSHTVSFNTVLGWTTPSNQVVTVTNLLTTPTVAAYVQQASLPATLTGTIVAGGGFHFVLNGTVGSNYLILASSDLTVWTPIATNIIPAIGFMPIMAANMTNYARRLYRAQAIPISPPQLSGVTVNNGVVQLLLTGEVGSTWVIEVTSNFVTWSAVSTNTIPAAGSVLISDPGAANQNPRFYRVETP